MASQGIFALSCAGCTFENLTIANLYVHTSTSDTSVDQTMDNGIVFSGSNITVANNTIHDVGWAVFARWAAGDANNRIYGNNVYNIDHGIILTAPAGTVGPMFVYDNHVHDMGNWDAETSSGGLPYHHDGIHCFGPENGATYNGLYIYDNRFDGTVGQLAPTAQIFIEGNYGSSGDTPCAAVGSQVDVFNNIFGSTDYPTSNGYLETSQPGGGVYNNTVMGVSTTDNEGGCFGYRQNVERHHRRLPEQPAQHLRQHHEREPLAVHLGQPRLQRLRQRRSKTASSVTATGTPSANSPAGSRAWAPTLTARRPPAPT